MWKAERSIRLAPEALFPVGWFGLVNGWRMTGILLLAAGIHELGHLAVLKAGGARVEALHIGVLGAELKTDTHRLSYGWELLAALGGPLANVLTALLCVITEKGVLLAGASMILCVFNLLPVRRLDGGRALRLLFVWGFGPDRGERAGGIVSAATAAVAGAGLLWLMHIAGGNLWLLPPAVWFLYQAGREFLGKT